MEAGLALAGGHEDGGGATDWGRRGVLHAWPASPQPCLVMTKFSLGEEGKERRRDNGAQVPYTICDATHE